MPTNPTTKSQVQAYRFVLRRMESALVRKDAVMLHEPMRNHLRASAVGLIVGLLGLAAFFVVGKFSPTSQVAGGEIVIGNPSEAVFVVQDNPRRLIPVLNLTSARLLVAAISPGRDAPDARRVADSALTAIPRARSTGLPGAPPLPAQNNLIRGSWSVCDTAKARPEVPSIQQPPLSTTVLIRDQPPPGLVLGDNQALLVQEQSTRTTFLVWHGRRGLVDLRDPAIKTLYRLANVVPRPVSAGLLNAVPEGHPLTLARIPGAGSPVAKLPGVQVGDVVRMKGAVEESYFLMLPQGKQPVERAVADVIRYHHSTATDFLDVTPEAIRQVPDAPAAGQLDFAGFPSPVPQILTTNDAPIACLTWTGPDKASVVSINADERLPLAEGESPVDVPGMRSSQTADSVFLKPTKGALVRGVVPGQRSGTGAIWLVTDQGLRYGVPSTDVARALGLGDVTTSAPEPILGLLPIGLTLDPQRALELFDPELARQQAEQRAGG
ncbi:MAG TPA: type VII secretion protein EccB [Pseudonocardiaceae bacterium]